MYRSLFVILCLLVGALSIGAQKRAPQPQLPSRDVQGIFDKIRAMTPEQRARLREIALTVLDERRAREQRARAQGVVPSTDQYPVPSPSGVTPSLDFSPTFCVFNCMPSAVAPPRPIFSESPIQGDFGGIDLKGFNGITLWDSGEFDRLMAKPINLDLDLDGFNERIEAATNGAIGALNQLQQQIAASNQPPVPRPADGKLTRPRSASVVSGDHTPAGKATAARAGGTLINRYNAPLPDSKDRIGNRARNPSSSRKPSKKNPTQGISFGIKPGAVLYDSRGNPRGEIDLNIPGRENRTQLSYGGERIIEVNGERKQAYDAFAVYLVTGELASGLILEKDFNVKPRMPSLMGPEPPDKGEKPYTITGGNRNAAPWKVNGVTLKVNPKVSHNGENSTDYGLRDGGVVNMCYSVPGTVRGGGGQCYDVFKVGATFFREKSVHSIPAKLYKPGSDVPVPGAELLFLYGYVNTPTGKRYGWMAREALLEK